MSRLAVVLSLLVSHAVAASEESGRREEVRGPIRAEKRDFGFARGKAYFVSFSPDPVSGSVRADVPLMVRAEEEEKKLDLLAFTGAWARVEGVWREINHRPSLFVETVKEIYP